LEIFIASVDRGFGGFGGFGGLDRVWGEARAKAHFVGRVVRGLKPPAIPVEQTTARAVLGLTSLNGRGRGGLVAGSFDQAQDRLFGCAL